MSIASYVIAATTLVFAGLVLFWVMRADESERPKPSPERLRRSPDESPTGPDDATTALRKAVEAGEAAAREKNKPGRDGSSRSQPRREVD
jgi:hypothetical protein